MTDTRPQQKKKRAIICLMFFLSGFCALLYQTIWLRLAFAKFGVITSVVSLVVAIFMLGLGLGSWAGGYYAPRLKKLFGGSAVTLYGIVECFIGTGAFIVPFLFDTGAHLCHIAGETNSWIYLLSSAVIITVSILPFSIAMGATYPIVLEFLREQSEQDERAFGSLYTANTAGAWLGAVTTVFILVEILGFRRILLLAASCNFLIGLTSFVWGRQVSVPVFQSIDNDSEKAVAPQILSKELQSMIILFTTGFCFMSMEVIWTRSFTPVLGNFVYSFASLVATYLAFSWWGASLYRISLKPKKLISVSWLVKLTALSSLLPLLASNPSLLKTITQANTNIPVAVLVIMSIMPISTLLGYLTPLIIDNLSHGNPNIAGTAYAINIIGCVLGPLLAGYILLPVLGAKISLILLIVPLTILAIVTRQEGEDSKARLLTRASTLFISLAVLINSFFWLSWEEGGQLKPDNNKVTIHRDYAATTIAYTTANRKVLLVNGESMTFLVPETKFMAHLPLAYHTGPSKSVLVICFGMGTTFRSSLAWGCKVTAVELVPGVIKAFNYYYPDAAEILSNPNSHIVIDDGRRFLQRSKEKFDVIIIDPPPPLATSASGLLYSKEFLHLIKEHLNPGGILQEWFFSKENNVYERAFLRTLEKEFPYVRLFVANYDPLASETGIHFLASESPIASLTAKELYERLPEKAKADLTDTIYVPSINTTPQQQLQQILASELSKDNPLSVPEKAIVITDDYPYNEYFLLQSLLGKQMFLMSQ